MSDNTKFLKVLHKQPKAKQLYIAILDESLPWNEIGLLYQSRIPLDTTLFDQIHEALMNSKYAEQYYRDWC